MLELILTEVVAGLGMAGVTRLAKTAHSRMSEKSPLVVKEAGLAQYFPRREALAKPIATSDIESLSFSNFLEEYIYDGKSSPIDCAEINIQLQNVSESRLSISGLGVNRHFLDEAPAASFLSIPQGRLVPGECYKFAVDLNADLPTVRHYEIENGVVAFYGDDRYFDGSTVEMKGGEVANFKFALLARAKPVEVGLYLRYETDHETGTIDLPLENPIRIYPLSSVPQDSRYRRTYMETPPVIALETDERFPDRNHKTRWEL